MGSLMGGWNSQALDPKSVMYKRNLSLTKGEIENYWRTKKKTEEEHLKALTTSPDSSEESTCEGSGRRLQKSSSLPLANSKGNFFNIDETNLEKFIKSSTWWTRSGSAHLNEPPVIASEGTPKEYAPEFHVEAATSIKDSVY